MDDKIFDILSKRLIGTDDPLNHVLYELGIDLSVETAGDKLFASNVTTCENCGVWSDDILDEYCADCYDEKYPNVTATFG